MIDYKYIKTVIKEAGDIILASNDDIQIYEKGRADFVTDKDVEVQKYVYEHLTSRYPEIGFIGEETIDHENVSGDKQWILDPIDGTTNYIYGYNMSAISLALKDKDEIVLGIVYNPFTGEFFHAEKGKGAFLNEKRIYVSEKKSLKESLVAVGTSPYNKEMAEEVFSRIKNIYKNSLDIRRTGSAALDLAYVACQRQDAYFEYNLKPWDFAAGSLLVQEAGGVIYDIRGQKLSYDKNMDILACCDKRVMEEMLDILL